MKEGFMVCKGHNPPWQVGNGSRLWQQEPAASGHIMPLARKQGTESEQKVEPNHKIPGPHLPAPVSPFCQWGSSSSSSIAFAKGHQLAGAHDPGETGVPALSVL